LHDRLRFETGFDVSRAPSPSSPQESERLARRQDECAGRAIRARAEGQRLRRCDGAPVARSKLGAEQDAYFTIDTVGNEFAGGGLNTGLRSQAELVIARYASHPLAANANLDPTSLPAYHALAKFLMLTR